MISRRRFLAIAAFFSIVGSQSLAQTSWTGHALGADVEIKLNGPKSISKPLISVLKTKLFEIENAFTLYNPTSELRTLNAQKHITPSSMFFDLATQALDLHQKTNGLFEPSVQTLWAAHAKNQKPTSLVPFSKVYISHDRITLDKDQSLTFNGIAQGYATDQIKLLLQKHGFEHVLINLEELSAIGGPWAVGLSDPDIGIFSTTTLHDQSIATSSPNAMRIIKDKGHILHPSDEESHFWSTVSVKANSACIVDGLSTAFCLMPAHQIRTVIRRYFKDVEAVSLRPDGVLRRLSVTA
jgi:thiamine biosynthesis lipoprotein